MLTLRGLKRHILHIAFSPDGRTLAATGVSPGDVELWSLPAGGEPVRWPGGKEWTKRPRFSPDGRILYYLGMLQGLVGRRTTTGATVSLPVDPDRENIQGFDLSPDGKRLVTAGIVWRNPGTIEFDINTDRTGYTRKKDGTLTQKWAMVPDDHTFSLTCLPGDRFVAVTNRHDPALNDNVRELVLCDLTTGKELLRQRADLPPDDEPLAASPGGEWLVGIARARYRLLVFDEATLQQVAVIPNPQGQKPFTGVTFTPDGKHLLASGTTGYVRAFAVGGWTEVKAWDWKLGPLTCVAVSADGTLAAAGTKTGTVVVWDLDL